MSFLFLNDNKGNIRKRLNDFFRQRWTVAFLGYAAFLFSSTIIARYRSQPIYSGLGTFGIIKDSKWNKEIIINICLFIPYTFLYCMAFSSKSNLPSSLLLSLCTAVFIELFQVLFWVGQGTIADVVHNIMGGMIGHGIWYLINAIMRKRAKNK